MSTAENAQHIIAEWRRFAGEKELCAADVVQREIDAMHAANAFCILWGDETYPAALRDLPDAPVVITGLGNSIHLTHKLVAIVGNRSASMAGLTWAQTLATHLARAGVATCSGLARGIDTAAHTGCLQGNAPTIAVVAGGVDHIYPPENAKLREAIIAHGCVLSEQPWGSTPTASLFPRRNRLIAGLSLGVVVSESTRHSGSLITAEYALDYGRDVWAVPGSPSDPRSGGPNWLLKQGATLIETAQDVLDTLPATPAPYIPRVGRAQPQQGSLFATNDPQPIPTTETEPAEDSLPQTIPPRTHVFGLLSNTPVTFDVLLRQSALSESALNALLVELELDGHATQDPDGRWHR